MRDAVGAKALRLFAGSALAALAFHSPATAQLPGDKVDAVVVAPIRPDLFGTVALVTSGGLWADRWEKVLTDSSVPSALRQMIAPAQGLGRYAQLAFVQAAVDRRLSWRSDGTQYGVRDYWATAAETLDAGFGDDEDRAILKFQALRALGYPGGDLFLMVGRDSVRGSYTMLAARADGRFYLLEERGETPVAASRRTGFTPVVSFGGGRSWLHGIRRAPPRLPAATLAAAAGTAAARK